MDKKTVYSQSITHPAKKRIVEEGDMFRLHVCKYIMYVCVYTTDCVPSTSQHGSIVHLTLVNISDETATYKDVESGLQFESAGV